MAAALALLLWLASASPAAAEPPVIDLVETRFGWPVGLEGSVSSTVTRSRTIEGRPEVNSARSSYEFRVAPAGEHLRIHVLEPKAEARSGEAAAQPEVAALLARASELVPDTIVSTEGEFVTVHDVAGYRTRLRAFLAGLLPDDFDSAALDRVLQRLTSEEMLNQSHEEQWNTVVGAWIGAELELGEPYVTSEREPSPVFPQATILMNYTFRAVRRLPCDRAGGVRDCVEFEFRSIADPGDTQEVLEKLLAQFTAEEKTPALYFSTLQVENVTRLVTEPDRLIPHRFEVVESMRATGMAEGKPMTIDKKNETITVYTYPAP